MNILFNDIYSESERGKKFFGMQESARKQIRLNMEPTANGKKSSVGCLLIAKEKMPWKSGGIRILVKESI